MWAVPALASKPSFSWVVLSRWWDMYHEDGVTCRSGRGRVVASVRMLPPSVPGPDSRHRLYVELSMKPFCS